MRKTALILLILLIGCATFLEAATTGRLAVRVRDNAGKPLEYVNIIVMRGNQRITGGQTDAKGSRILINIPPGMYTVKFSLIGYDSVTYTDVRIQVDQTASLSPVMKKAGVKIASVTVTAEQDVVGKDRTASERQIEMDRMSDVSVSDVAGIMALQAGVSNIGGELHVRGSRANEINFTVDGQSVTDPVDGGSALQVDTDAILDMKVMTGGFPAEYGNAQAAVVNIVTKDGDPFFSGKIEYNTDHIIGSGRNSDVVKFAIGGPIWALGSEKLRERLTFFFNGGGEWMDGRMKEYYVADPMSEYVFYDSLTGMNRQLLEYEYPVNDPYADRTRFLGIDFGNRNYNAYNVNLKTKFVISDIQRITLGIRGDRSLDYPFSWQNRYALDTYAVSETEQRQYVANYEYAFNPAMNIKVKGSYYQKDSKTGPRGIDRSNYLYMYDGLDPENPGEDYVDNVLLGNQGWDSVDHNSDGVYSPDYNGDGISDADYFDYSFWTYRIASVEDPRMVTGFTPPGYIYQFFQDDITTSASARADFEWQVNETHLAKTGLELIKHSIKKDQLQNFLNIYEDRFQASLKRKWNGLADFVPEYDADGNITNVPNELYSMYQTDDGVLIPIYKPADYFKAAQEASGKRDGYQADPWQAAYYLQDKMVWEGMIVNAGLRLDLWYLGTKYKVLQDDASYREVDFDPSERWQLMLSPRLGVSHPITDRDVLRFAYNYQNQLPQMQFIFTSKTPADANVSDQTITVGNTKLEPQITKTYEVGLSHQLSDDYVLDMTAYYKNLYNYVSTMKVAKPGEEQIFWYQFISEDYGSARGIDVQLEKMMSNFNNWSVAYSLAWAQGNNSSTVIQDEATNLREFPLDWDVRHNLSLNYTFRIGRGEEFFVPFTDFILPVDDLSANINWSFASGAPYTPQSVEGNSMLDTNSGRKKFTHQANLRITKGITLSQKMNLRLFMDVENLFGTRNVYTVYPKTGSELHTGSEPDLADANTGYTYPEVRFVYDKYIQNPSFWSNYRGVTFGVSFNF